MHLFTALRARSRPHGVCASVCLCRSVSVCQSVCIGRAGHTNEHTHDVNNAVSSGMHHRHRERLPLKPHQFLILNKHQKAHASTPVSQHRRGPLKLIKRINPAAILRLVRASTTPRHLRRGRISTLEWLAPDVLVLTKDFFGLVAPLVAW